MSESQVMLSVNDVVLPSPTSIQVDNEIIWSADSGRDLSGLFSGDVVAEKKTITVDWGILTEDELMIIQEKLCSGYFSLRFRDVAGHITIDAYRGTLSKTLLGYVGDGILYYKTASCKIVQR